jgi:hypothetical protein
VTILILLVLVVLLWVAVLAPSVWRRYGERRGVGSIDSFHHELQLLEHAGPKTVAPAYRLHTATPGGAVAEDPTPSGDASRPKLVLLRPTADAEAADVDDAVGGHYERVGVLDRPEPACVPEITSDLPAFRREEARHRCTVLLRCLCGVAVSTALIGLFPKLHFAWVLTGIAGVAALALVGLMAYAKEIEAEQEHRRARRTAGRPESGWEDEWREASMAPTWSGGELDAAVAGYPGGWDDDVDDFEVPRVAAR